VVAGSVLGGKTAVRQRVFPLIWMASILLASCAGPTGRTQQSETARWLRTAGHFDETPEEIECIETAMHATLSEDELHQWLSQKPERLTVEKLQALPHAIDVADRCRHLMPLGAP
jgi:hypothetical protein